MIKQTTVKITDKGKVCANRLSFALLELRVVHSALDYARIQIQMKTLLHECLSQWKIDNVQLSCLRTQSRRAWQSIH